MYNFLSKHFRFKFRYLHERVLNFSGIFILFLTFFARPGLATGPCETVMNRFGNRSSRSVLKLCIKKVKALFVRMLSGFYIHSFTSDKV